MSPVAPSRDGRSLGRPLPAAVRLLALGCALAAQSLPSAALACAVCGGGVERSRMAFFGTTILLSLLPLALMAGGLLWIARHARSRLQGEFVDRDSPPGPVVARSAEPAGPSPGTDALLATPGASREA